MAHGSKAQAQFGRSTAQPLTPQFMPVPPVQAKPLAQPTEMPEIALDPRNYQIDLANPLASMYGHSSAIHAPVQAKLTVGAVGDKYEQEADRVAAQVVETINSPSSSEPAQREAIEEEELQMKPTLQREAMEEEELQMKPTLQREAMEEEELQMKPETVQRVGAEGGSVSDEFETQLQGAKGSGQALDANLQAQMGQAMGADFSGVKVHTDAQSHQLNQAIQAKAFTTGQDVFFSPGAYKPSTKEGQELIAHELTHVVQQTDSGKRKQQHTLPNFARRGLQKRGFSWGRDGLSSSDKTAFSGRTFRQPARANSFGKKNIGEDTSLNQSSKSSSPYGIQCYKTSAGFFGNKVTFESTALNAAVPGPLDIVKTGADVQIGSQWYGATGTVKASGEKASRVDKYEVGFLQTVYDSRRTAYYEPDPYNPSLPQKIGTAILPSLLGDRYKVTDLCSPLPVRDGDTGVKPWYEIGDVNDFGNAKVSTQNTRIDDKPETTFDWTKNIGGKTQNLVKTRGQDVFRSWLSVQKKGTTGFLGMHRLGYVDWKVDYGTDITYNKGNPAASVVTPTANSGAQIIGTNEGPGVKLPLMGDPTANDAAKDVESKW